MEAVNKKKKAVTSEEKQLLIEKRAAIEAAIQKKRKCEKVALDIVEHLVEHQQVDSLWLKEKAAFMNPTYYQDATEERALLLMCGYPLCPKKIEKVIKQQYSINLKAKKVYDLTQRKNFCSDACYHSSTHFKNQLLTSPLWSRDDEIAPHFNLLLNSSKGLKGEEVDVIQLAHPEVDREEAEEEENIPEKNAKKSTTSSKISQTPFVPPSQVVFLAMKRWFTNKTINWLKNEDTEQNLSEHQIQPKSTPSAPSKKSLEDKMAALKVRAFITGQLQFSTEDEKEEKTIRERTITDASGDDVPIVMPPVDFSAQKTLRKQIVLDYVEKGISKMNITGLRYSELKKDFHQLVSTFELTADCITFRPTETLLLTIALLITLSKRNPSVKLLLDETRVKESLSRFFELDRIFEIEKFVNSLCTTTE